MNNRFADAINEAAQAQPQAAPVLTAGRVLLLDGDALAYTCAGSDDTSPGKARRNLEDKVDATLRASGAERAVMLVTSPASTKGHRFAIARIKSYQGHRKDGRKPRQWETLRALIATDSRSIVTDTLEADDLFHEHSERLGAERVVILTQDKDLRMVPGWHMDWTTHAMTFVPRGTWALEAGGKLYGRKWFWQQMLQGDAADSVPGCSAIAINGKRMACGEARAKGLLLGVDAERAAAARVLGCYRFAYGEEDYRASFIEQACLLWMRRSSRLFDCTHPGGPLDFLFGTSDPAWLAALRTVSSRVVDL